MTIADDSTRQIVDALRDISRRVRRLETLEYPFTVDFGAISPPVSAFFGKIIRILHDGGGVEIYEVDRDGMLGALGSALPEDAIITPNCRLPGDYVFPDDVVVRSYGEKTIIDGSITLRPGSFAIDIEIERIVYGGQQGYLYLYDYADAYGFIGPINGVGTIQRCSVTITHTGIGHIYGAYQGNAAGRLEIFDSKILGAHIGLLGNVYGVSVANGAEAYVEETILYSAAVNPNRGYGGFVWAGDLTVEGGSSYGSTSRFGKS